MNKIITVNTGNQFKDNAISLNIPLKLDKYVTHYNLIASILKRGCNKYSSTKELWKHLQNMYGAVFDIITLKRGEMFLISFYVQFIDNRYALNGEDILKEAVELLSEFLYRPLINDGKFNESYFSTEKENLRILIQSKIDDKDEYAIDRAIEICCKDEPYEIYRYGDEETLNNIKNEELVKIWKNVLETSDMHFYICGNVDESQGNKLINNYFKECNTKELLKKSTTHKNEKCDVVVEKMNVNQGKLAICFRTEYNVLNKGYISTAVMNSILGGGIHSKLFIEVREKNSLAYYCYSFVEKFKGLLIIAAGIDVKNYEKSKEIIFKQIEDIKSGNISELELTSSKNKLISDIQKVKDTQYNLMNYLAALEVHGLKGGIDETIKDIEKIEAADVIDACNKLQLGSIYLLKKGE